MNGNPSEQFAEVVGLDDVIAGTEVEEFDFFVDGVARGENYGALTSCAFQVEENVAAGAIRYREEDEAGVVFSGEGEALHDTVGVGGVVAGVLEVVLEDGGDVVVVFDDEDMGHIGIFRGWS